METPKEKEESWEFEEFMPDSEEEEIKKHENKEQALQLVHQSESVFSDFSMMSLSGENEFQWPSKDNPNYKIVVSLVQDILEYLVYKNPDNVVDFFSECSRRFNLQFNETNGIGNRYFRNFAIIYSRLMKGYTLGFEKIRDEHYEDLIPVNQIKEEEENENDYFAEHIMEYDIGEDDFDEGGRFGVQIDYPKGNEYNEFEYNFLEHMKIFEDAGVGIPKHEQFELHMALLKLKKKRKLENLIFWGKISGLYRDYFVAEADMYSPDQEKYDQLEEVEEDKETMSFKIIEEEAQESTYYKEEFLGESVTDEEMYYKEIEGEMRDEVISDFNLEVDEGLAPPTGKITLKNYKLPKLPEIQYLPEPKPPIEEAGDGANKKIYFVCNDPKADWIRLPHVTPEQIVVARQIKKFFTGYLSAKIVSFPAFPGIEMNYLRAQIARISAGTQISPAGYYRFDEGEEAYDPDEIAEGRGAIIVNRDFEPMNLTDLTEPSLGLWVHHAQHILKQGRTVWFNIADLDKMEYMGEEMLEEEEKIVDRPDIMGEKGPPLLTSLAEDIYLEGIQPWTVRPALERAPGDACVLVISNLWPGSYSFNWGRRNGFIYLGWGLKHTANTFTPTQPYDPFEEYKTGPETIEIRDPTVAEEEDFKKVLDAWWLERHPPIPEGAQGEGGEGEQSEDEDV